MSFANMSPADRTKASALVGLIVVVLFIAIWTVAGALKPKGQAGGGPGGPAAAGASPTVPPPLPGNPQQTAAADAQDPWDISRIKKGGKMHVAEALPEVGDPFIPLKKADKPAPAPAPAAPPAPKVDTEPAVRLDPVPGPGDSHRTLPPLSTGPVVPSIPFTAPSVNPLAPVAPPAPEPEIHVVGVVEGDDSVATISVAGKTQLYRPGEALADNYRLMAVDGEGIKIRHNGEYKSLHVGDTLNDASAGKKP